MQRGGRRNNGPVVIREQPGSHSSDPSEPASFSLVDFFAGKIPRKHEDRNSNMNMKDKCGSESKEDTLFSGSNTRIKSIVEDVASYLQDEEDDEEYAYVRKYKEQENLLVKEVNEQESSSTCGGQKERPIQNTGRYQKIRSNPDESILGSIASAVHDSERQGEISEETFYQQFDMSRRNFDSSSLVIYSCKEKIMDALKNSQVVIVEGFTGCGKTTQVPQFILDESAKHKEFCSIIVTQPRRIAAISVATRVADERGWPIPGLVGYQVGMNKKTNDDSRLVYMTTGVLLQVIINRKSLDQWTHIIIDEVHERDLETDLLMLVLKTLMIEGRDTRIKIILMSATLNAEKFQKYFPVWKSCGVGNTGAEIIKVPQSTIYPVDIVYLNDVEGHEMSRCYVREFYDEPKIANEIYDMAVFLISGFDKMETGNKEKNTRGDAERGAVLVFLPGLLEIETLYKALQMAQKTKDKNNQEVDMKWLLLPLHSSITKEEQGRVFLPAPRSYRKIILATNIAESSITVTDIKYVIDFCLTKSLSCDPLTNYVCLRMEWASKYQCIQRKGRCGRVSAGICYRLVPKQFYDRFVQEAAPEMEKSSLESVVLHVKNLDIGSPKKRLSLALDPPKLSGIRRAVANLKEVGALTIMRKEGKKEYSPYDGDLTYLGRIMSRLPIDMRFGRLIAVAYCMGVLEEAIIIAAGLSTKSPFSFPYNRRLDAYLSKLAWTNESFSDCFALIFVYKEWSNQFKSGKFRQTVAEKNWTQRFMVQGNVMREISDLVNEIQRRLSMIEIEAKFDDKFFSSNMSADNALLLKVAIAAAFYPNLFVRFRPQKTEMMRNVGKGLSSRNPLTTVALHGTPTELPMDLYRHHFVAPFQHNGLGLTIPYAEHDGSKVFIKFDPLSIKIGPACLGVYQAVKMRHLREHISFKLIKANEEDRLVAQMQQKLSLEAKTRHNVAPAQTMMPDIDKHKYEVRVCHVNSPGEFFIIKDSDWNDAKKIESALKNIHESLHPVRRIDIKLGDLMLIKDSPSSCVYARARVETILHRSVGLYLIDEGGLVERSFNEIWTMRRWNQSLLTIPGLAIQCRLVNCCPPARTSRTWCRETLDRFASLVKDRKFTLKIFSVVDSIIAGDLVDTDKRSVIENLKSEGLVEFYEEPDDSTGNNNLRHSTVVMRGTVQDKLDWTMTQVRNQIFNPSPIQDPPRISGSPETITTRGPNTPLEMTFNSLLRSSHLKQVNVDGSSINSIALDTDYLKPCSRLLIAGSIGVSHRSGNLMARETTLMPPIPGLPGLITLLFCPLMELRVNPGCTKYTGAIAGLGLDPVNREPIYPDHDVEIFFDTVVDNDDIDQINRIRKTMNLMLVPNTAPVKLNQLRNECRKIMKELLSKSREPIEEVWPNFTHQWGGQAQFEDRILRPEGGGDQVRAIFSDVFPLHWAIDLSPENEADECSFY